MAKDSEEVTTQVYGEPVNVYGEMPKELQDLVTKKLMQHAATTRKKVKVKNGH